MMTNIGVPSDMATFAKALVLFIDTSTEGVTDMEDDELEVEVVQLSDDERDDDDDDQNVHASYSDDESYDDQVDYEEATVDYGELYPSSDDTIEEKEAADDVLVTEASLFFNDIPKIEAVHMMKLLFSVGTAYSLTDRFGELEYLKNPEEWNVSRGKLYWILAAVMACISDRANSNNHTAIRAWLQPWMLYCNTILQDWCDTHMENTRTRMAAYHLGGQILHAEQHQTYMNVLMTMQLNLTQVLPLLHNQFSLLTDRTVAAQTKEYLQLLRQFVIESPDFQSNAFIRSALNDLVPRDFTEVQLRNKYNITNTVLSMEEPDLDTLNTKFSMIIRTYEVSQALDLQPHLMKYLTTDDAVLASAACFPYMRKSKDDKKLHARLTCTLVNRSSMALELDAFAANAVRSLIETENEEENADVLDFNSYLQRRTWLTEYLFPLVLVLNVDPRQLLDVLTRGFQKSLVNTKNALSKLPDGNTVSMTELDRAFDDLSNRFTEQLGMLNANSRRLQLSDEKETQHAGLMVMVNNTNTLSKVMSVKHDANRRPVLVMAGDAKPIND